MCALRRNLERLQGPSKEGLSRGGTHPFGTFTSGKLSTAANYL